MKSEGKPVVDKGKGKKRATLFVDDPSSPRSDSGDGWSSHDAEVDETLRRGGALTHRGRAVWNPNSKVDAVDDAELRALGGSSSDGRVTVVLKDADKLVECHIQYGQAYIESPIRLRRAEEYKGKLPKPVFIEVGEWTGIENLSELKKLSKWLEKKQPDITAAQRPQVAKGVKELIQLFEAVKPEAEKEKGKPKPGAIVQGIINFYEKDRTAWDQSPPDETFETNVQGKIAGYEAQRHFPLDRPKISTGVNVKEMIRKIEQEREQARERKQQQELRHEQQMMSLQGFAEAQADVVLRRTLSEGATPIARAHPAHEAQIRTALYETGHDIATSGNRKSDNQIVRALEGSLKKHDVPKRDSAGVARAYLEHVKRARAVGEASKKEPDHYQQGLIGESRKQFDKKSEDEKKTTVTDEIVKKLGLSPGHVKRLAAQFDGLHPQSPAQRSVDSTASNAMAPTQPTVPEPGAALPQQDAQSTISEPPISQVAPADAPESWAERASSALGSLFSSPFSGGQPASPMSPTAPRRDRAGIQSSNVGSDNQSELSDRQSATSERAPEATPQTPRGRLDSTTGSDTSNVFEAEDPNRWRFLKDCVKLATSKEGYSLPAFKDKSDDFLIADSSANDSQFRIRASGADNHYTVAAEGTGSCDFAAATAAAIKSKIGDKATVTIGVSENGQPAFLEKEELDDDMRNSLIAMAMSAKAKGLTNLVIRDPVIADEMKKDLERVAGVNIHVIIDGPAQRARLR